MVVWRPQGHGNYVVAKRSGNSMDLNYNIQPSNLNVTLALVRMENVDSNIIPQ